MVKTLFNRVNTHISDNKLKHREQLHIHSTLQPNGFPTRTTFLSPRKACSQDSPYKHFTSIPYVQEKIRKVLNEAGVNVALRPVHTIHYVLPLPKDPYTSEDIGCIIYEIPCLDCNFVYIGQTKRGLKSRLAEHKRATLNQKPEQSALCVHEMEFEHNTDWISAKILKVENNCSKRLVSEAWFINSRPNVMNRSNGDKLPQVYQILL